MGFRNGAYARIWKKDKQEITYGSGQSFTKYLAQVSISRKDEKASSGYRQLFNGFCELRGDALEEMKGVKIPQGGLSVKLGSVDLENQYDSAKNMTYWHPIIWSFDHDDGTNETKPKFNTRNARKEAEPVSEDEDLPF